MTAPNQQARWRPLPRVFRELAAGAAEALLLETAKPSGADDQSLLFLHPSGRLTAQAADDLPRVLEQVDRLVAAGKHVAGYFEYECGEAFVGLPPRRSASLRAQPLASLGVYDDVIRFRHADGTVIGHLPSVPVPANDAEPIAITPAGLDIDPVAYSRCIARVQDYLRAGDTYQVNFTDRICGYVSGSPLAVYETLLAQQPVAFAAFLTAPDRLALSFSPELFYRTAHGRITVRPMKGTWPRGATAREDADAASALLHDEKNRAEHITIVDLLRNDLGKICEPGSVMTPNLFTIERYPTLLQTTSTITGSLDPRRTPSQIFQALFPSGSITGAPKRRTMQIIQEVERHPRGLYTGGIGYFAPHGEAGFSVAIRTLALHAGRFVLGVGGGITADSVAEDEYRECQLKGAFLTRRRPQFSLIETMRCEAGIPHLTHHLDRLCASASYFDFPCDVAELSRLLLEAAASCGTVPQKIRLLLDSVGRATLTCEELARAGPTASLMLSDTRVAADDIFLRHKTTHRRVYDTALQQARAQGFDDVLFRNEEGHITECAIANIFALIDGQWRTPALRCGVLPGIQRALQLEGLGSNAETTISLGDLCAATQISIGNSVRGMRPVHSIASAAGDILWRAVTA